MRPCSSLATRRVLVLSYLPWTISTPILPLQPEIRVTLYRSVPLLQWESAPSTVIITRQITRRFIALQWVSITYTPCCVLTTNVLLVLHPRHKLHYFKTAGWEVEWIETAHNIVREEFDRTYAFMDIDNEAVPTVKVSFIHFRVLLLISTSRRHRLPTYLMIYPPSLLPSHPSCATNSTDISALTLSRS